MENILLDYDETTNKMIVELTDFGLATYASDSKATSIKAGTIVYMAPEMLMQ